MGTRQLINKSFAVITAAIALALFVQSCSQHKGAFHISGDVGKEYQLVAVEMKNSHPSSASFKLHRIWNGKVSLDIDLDSNMVYELFLFNDGVWNPCYFFADGREITIVKNDSEYRRWIINSDSPQNLAYQNFLDGKENMLESSGILDSLDFSFEEFYTPEYRSLHDRCWSDTTSKSSQSLICAEMERMKQDGSAYTSSGRHYNSLCHKYHLLEDEYYKSHIDDVPFGLASFNIVVEALANAQSRDLDISYWLSYYQKKYAEEFPGCNLHNDVLDIIGKSTMIEGNQYVDFSLPDDKGQIQTVSELIDGKVAVIELWASWCRPCLDRLVELKPLYEKYKDKGFVVVSAAREDESDEDWRRIIAKEKFPWVNMIDMNPLHPIWSYYGMANGSGVAYLFGTDGRLIKQSPSLQDIEDAIVASQEKSNN